ncbi:MAG: MarR family transcriptional regulator [Nevskiaceae bacterium]|jgi:MarR family transcriptional repressor of emrRAB|nr:MarR family transcriptional regulator [Nevskiaceae bacterium]
MPYSQVAQVHDAAQRIADRCPQMRVDESLLCRVLVLVGRDLVARLDRLISPEALSDLEYRLLMLLFAQGGSASPGELCKQLAQSPANLTRIGDLLCARDLIRRSPHPVDRRRQIISITPAGEKLVQQLLPRLTSAMTQLFDNFAPDERERFLQYLMRLMQALDGASDEASPSPA